MNGLSGDERISIILLVVGIIPECHGQTDGWTDGRTDGIASIAQCIHKWMRTRVKSQPSVWLMLWLKSVLNPQWLNWPSL